MVDQRVDFLREMYNLTTQIAALAGDLDHEKKGSLQDIHNAASKVLSLSSAKNCSLGSNIMDSIREEGRETQGPQDDLGVFEAEDIQNVLYKMDYEIEYIPWGVRLILLHSVEFELTLAVASSTRRNRQQGWRQAWISQVRGTRERGQGSAIPHRDRVSLKPHNLRCSILAC